MKTPDQRCRERGAEREEPAYIGERASTVAGQDLGIKIERIKRGGEQPDLMLAHLTQERRREPMLTEEVEHTDGAIMTRGIVGRAGELVASRSIGYPVRSLPVAQNGKLAEPPRHDRPQVGIRGDPQIAVSLPQLAILVTAAHNKGVAESLVSERDRYRVERVIRVHQEPAPMATAARRHLGEPTGNPHGVEENG